MADMHFKDTVIKRTTTEKVRECKGKEGAKEKERDEEAGKKRWKFVLHLQLHFAQLIFEKFEKNNMKKNTGIEIYPASAKENIFIFPDSLLFLMRHIMRVIIKHTHTFLQARNTGCAADHNKT